MIGRVIHKISPKREKYFFNSCMTSSGGQKQKRPTRSDEHYESGAQAAHSLYWTLRSLNFANYLELYLKCQVLFINIHKFFAPWTVFFNGHFPVHFFPFPEDLPAYGAIDRIVIISVALFDFHAPQPLSSLQNSPYLLDQFISTSGNYEKNRNEDPEPATNQ